MKGKNNKGQALVEFVLLIPIILIIIFTSFDFSRIIYEKTKLENLTNDAINKIENNNDYDSVVNLIKKKDKDIKLEIKYQDNNTMNVKLEKKIRIFTPGLNLVISSPYKISVERVIDYEKNE